MTPDPLNGDRLALQGRDAAPAASARLAAAGGDELAPSVLTRAEAAKVLRVSVGKLDGLLRSGELRHVSFGRSVRIAMSDVQRMLDEKLTASPADRPRWTPEALARRQETRRRRHRK
jgi:excisionase family DNA binding protein